MSTVSIQLNELARSPKSTITICKTQYGPSWTAAFECDGDTTTIRIRHTADTFDDAVNGLYEKVMEAGNFGVPEILPLHIIDQSTKNPLDESMPF